MFVALSLPIALVVLVKLYAVGGKSLRRRAARDPLTRVFHAGELRELDAHLDRIAVAEVRRLDANVVRYVAGDVGHVVVVSQSPHGIALGLSDGRRLALGSVSRSTLKLLMRRVTDDKLRPARVDRDSLSYRLLLRGEAGAEIEVCTRRLALAP
ncbi:MAG: hypothetical protein JWO11_3436 [Nocardioides sp.]|nr:hypothetical protein [Nocardioides sp.]